MGDQYREFQSSPKVCYIAQTFLRNSSISVSQINQRFDLNRNEQPSLAVLHAPGSTEIGE